MGEVELGVPIFDLTREKDDVAGEEDEGGGGSLLVALVHPASINT